MQYSKAQYPGRPLDALGAESNSKTPPLAAKGFNDPSPVVAQKCLGEMVQ